MLHKIENSEELVKDTEAGAVLNVNREGLKAYRIKRAAKTEAQADKQRIAQLEAKVEALLIALKLQG